MMIRRWMTVLGALSILIVGACNTIEGAGKDIETGGEKISDAAEDVKEKM